MRAVSFSVALSLKSPSPGVTRHPVLWSPDFPHAPALALNVPAIVSADSENIIILNKKSDKVQLQTHQESHIRESFCKFICQHGHKDPFCLPVAGDNALYAVFGKKDGDMVLYLT